MPQYTAYEDLTVSSVSKRLTKATFGTSSTALITIENNPIRYRLDGGTPTASLGHLANAGDRITLQDANELENFRAIRLAADAALRVSYGQS